jgi:hypothetical protein
MWKTQGDGYLGELQQSFRYLRARFRPRGAFNNIMSEVSDTQGELVKGMAYYLLPQG